MDNLNISFAPDKSAEDKGRINAVEDYLSLLTERIKFCLNGIDENIAQKSDGEEEKQLIYSTIADEVGQFTNTDKNCEVFNDYENNVASAYYSHAEGYKTTANAPYSHAEGSNTVASDLSCHAEGSGTTASGNCSHAENTGCIASGSNSHAEGYHTIARGEHSHASGSHTIAGMEVFALGRYNKKAEDVALVVGNGWGNDSHEYRSDALTLDYSGNLKLAGNLTANSPGWDYLGAEIHGAARFGNNWTSDSTSILLAVGNGADSKNLRDALTLDSDGNLHISGKLTADGGVGYVLPSATADTLGGVMIGDNISVTADGVISVDMSEYLKNADIADWAKGDEKPSYTAEEVGAAEKNHTHNMSDITDMPEWTKTENKPAYTASEVGAATAADITAAVNAVEIGGRNLLYDSTGNIKNGWSGNTIITVDGGISGNSLAISRTDYSGNARYFGTNKRHFLTDFEVGASYTLSAWIKVRSDVELDASGYVMARFRSADDKKLYALSLTVSSQTEKDKWIYYEKTWTINDSDIAKLECVALALDKNGMIEACNIKLEKGTKATDWSPAPEDTTAEITSLSSKQSSLEQTVNGFKATVESTYATNDSVTQKVSAVEQKADKISWIVKSGTSESSMELTSKALEIIAETKIKGDVIVGGVIKSGNYDVAKGTGMKLTLATGEWDSKYFKVSSTGTITATGGTIGGWNIEDGIASTSSDNLMAVTIRPINVSGIPWLYVGKKAKASDTSWSYPFQLLPDGSAKCDSITINGSGKGLTSSLTDGSYSQNITINSGVFSMTCKNASSPNVYSATGSIHCGAIHRNIGGMFIDSANGVLINQAVKIDPYGITFMYPDSESVKGNSIYFQTASDSGNNGRTPYVSVSSDGVFYIGNSGKTLYLSGTPINASRSITVVSDARMKNHIADLPSGSENLFDYLDGKSFFYNGDTSTAKNYGFIAQDVLTALQKCGLTTDDFAGFCDIHGDGSQYALAYEQFIPLMWNEIKRLRKALSERS